MIPTHPKYPQRFCNEVITKSLDDSEWNKATREQKKRWVDIYLTNRPIYTDQTVYDNEGIWADCSSVSYDTLSKRQVWQNDELVPLYKTSIQFNNGKPVTPVLTGITGRGMLGKFGPNHAADPIITRYNSKTGDLEFVAGLRADTNEELWCIPGGMVDEGESVSLTLKREFKEEVAKNCSENILSKIFKNGTVLYSGPTYNDPRTTDQAWIETYVVHYHIDNELSKQLPLTSQPGENRKVSWISCKTPNLYGDHKKFIELAILNQKKKENRIYKIYLLTIISSIATTILVGLYFR